MSRDQRKTVRWTDITLVPNDHVAVAVPVRGRAEIRAVLCEHHIHQLMRPGRVRVRVHPAKVRLRRAMHHGAL